MDASTKNMSFKVAWSKDLKGEDKALSQKTDNSSTGGLTKLCVTHLILIKCLIADPIQSSKENGKKLGITTFSQPTDEIRAIE